MQRGGDGLPETQVFVTARLYEAARLFRNSTCPGNIRSCVLNAEQAARLKRLDLIGITPPFLSFDRFLHRILKIGRRILVIAKQFLRKIVGGHLPRSTREPNLTLQNQY